MSIAGLLRSPELRRREFPITARKAFLAHAAASPLPRRVRAAIQGYVRRAAAQGQWEFLYTEAEEETRRYAAGLLGVEEAEIAFVPSTSVGLSLVACGFPWEPGDNVVIAEGDFPSNIYPWLNLERRGVQARFIPRRKDGAITLEDVAGVVNSRTRLASLSSVNFVTGFRLDLASIGEYLHGRSVLFCVDAVQGLGAVPMDVTHVDFLAASAHKWLLGPMGVGVLMVRREHFGRLQPAIAGWKCVKNNKNYSACDLDFLDSAQRYEPGSPNVLGIVGLHAALGLLLEVGIESIAVRLARLRGVAVAGLREKGYEVLGPSDGKRSAGITSFTSQRQDMARLRNDLDASGFVVSLRDCFEGGRCIRLSPHFYNTEEEIMQLLDRLPRL